MADISGAYWKGADGNYYLRASNVNGVVNLGVDPSQNPNFVNYVNSGQYSQIEDPVAPAAPTNLVPSGGGGGGGGTSYTDTTAARNATQTSIDSLGQILANRLAGANGEYDSIIKAYTQEEALNQAAYDKQVTGNEQTREAARQAALAAAAQGSRGLFATLSSIGALGGTGKVLAGRAVSREANSDIGSADKVFDTNATVLFDTRSKLKQQEEQRRKDAEKIKEDTIKQSKYDAAEQQQKLWKDMADLWTKAGNNTEAANAMAKASAMTPELVANTRPTVTQYATAPLQYSAPALEGYLAGANDMTVKTSSGGTPINGAIYTSTKKREEL